MKQTVKHLLLIVLLGYFGEISAQRARVEHIMTLQEKVTKAEFIFEARVIAAKAFKSKYGIITCHYYLLSREFKGNFPTDTIKMVTYGGTVDGETETVSEQHGTCGDGIFFCHSMSASVYNLGDGNIYYSIYEEQGGICYFNGQIACGNEIYKDLVKDLYQPIEQLVGHPCKQVGLNSFEEAAIDAKAKKEQQKKEDAARQLASETIFYRITNVNYHYDTTIKFPERQFGIFIGVNYDPKLFVSGDIYLTYDTAAYGVNIVAQKKFTAKLADVNPKVYSLTVSDFAPGIIKCSVMSDTTEVALLDTLVQPRNKQHVLLQCTVKFDRVKGQHYTLWFDREKIKGQSKYYDPIQKRVIKFSHVASMQELAL